MTSSATTASSAIVFDSKSCRGLSLSPASLARPMIWIPTMESPPNSKKLSLMPIWSIPSKSCQMSARIRWRPSLGIEYSLLRKGLRCRDSSGRARAARPRCAAAFSCHFRSRAFKSTVDTATCCTGPRRMTLENASWPCSVVISVSAIPPLALPAARSPVDQLSQFTVIQWARPDRLLFHTNESMKA